MLAQILALPTCLTLPAPLARVCFVRGLTAPPAAFHFTPALPQLLVNLQSTAHEAAWTLCWRRRGGTLLPPLS